MTNTTYPGRAANLLTASEVAAYLACSERTVRRWTQDGLLPAFTVGRMRRYDPDLIRAMAAQKTPTTSNAARGTGDAAKADAAARHAG